VTNESGPRGPASERAGTDGPRRPEAAALTREEFLAHLAARLSWDPTSLDPTIRLHELPQDRAAVAYLYRALADLLQDPPADLLRQIETIGEAYEWYLQRIEHDPAGAARGAGRPRPDPGVYLRPVEERDYAGLYRASIEPGSAFRWRYRGATPSIERFVAGLHEGVLVQHMVQAIDGPTVGLVVCYQASMESRTAYFGLLRTAETSQEGRMFEGLMLFLQFLFDTWDFRKLYAEVPEFNFDGLLSPTPRGIDIEGIQRQHLFHEGRWWDQYLIALWRERWDAEVETWFGDRSPPVAASTRS
jgi:RimJ/RimL family protein N-acetyltransferase